MRTPKKPTEFRPAEVRWEGDSLDVLSSFPDDVRLTLSYSLRRMQNGLLPACGARSMSSVGDGVWELKTDDERTWYRVMYLTRIGDVIHVLHCLKKPVTELPVGNQQYAKRLSAVQQRIREEKK